MEGGRRKGGGRRGKEGKEVGRREEEIGGWEGEREKGGEVQWQWYD